VNDTRVIVINADSGRALEWHDEGDGQHFLVEADFEPSSAAEFRFLSDDSIALPCPRIANARYGAYNIVSSSSSSSDGLGPYKEDGIEKTKNHKGYHGIISFLSGSAILACCPASLMIVIKVPPW
jgi:hypothetical protein